MRRARRGARLPARAQAPRQGVGRARVRARLPALSADAMARRRRLPSRRARDAAPARRDLVPRREPAAAVRALRRRGLPDEGADRARRRHARALVRVRARPAARGPRDRARRGRRRGRRHRRDRAALRAGRRARRSRAATPTSAARRPASSRRPSCIRSACSRPRPSTATSLPLGSARAARRAAAPLTARRASALPELALNLLSSTRTQTSIHFHYTAGAIPGLVAAPCSAPPRLQRRAPRLRPRASAAGSSCSCSSPGIVLGPAARLAARALRLEARDARHHSSPRTTAPPRACSRPSRPASR